MRTRFIIIILALCSIKLIVGSVFAVQIYNVEDPDFKCSRPYSGAYYNNGNNQGKAGDCIQGLILAPMVITKAFCDNRKIISS